MYKILWCKKYVVIPYVKANKIVLKNQRKNILLIAHALKRAKLVLPSTIQTHIKNIPPAFAVFFKIFRSIQRKQTMV